MGAQAINSKRELRSMNHRLMHGLLFVRHRAQPVRNEDWQEMLEEIERRLKPGGMLRILVKTDNAGPNVVQRAKINDLLTSKNAKLRVAVLSSSMLVRGIVTAFSWMRTMEIKAFGPHDYAGGLAYLEASTSVETAQRAIGDIEQDVG